jgi:hypothetical protein
MEVKPWSPKEETVLEMSRMTSVGVEVQVEVRLMMPRFSRT